MPGATGEEDRKHLCERGLRVGERLGEDTLHLLIEVGDDGEQVGARLREVLQLLREEAVALLERGEFFERKRVDAAELCEPLLGFGEALLLFGAHEGTKLRGVGRIAFDRVLFRCLCASTGLGLPRLFDKPELCGKLGLEVAEGFCYGLRLLGDGRFCAGHRHAAVRPVFVDEHLFDEPELVAGALKQRRKLQLALIAFQLGTVHAIGERLQAAAQIGLLRAQQRELLAVPCALLFCTLLRHARLRQRTIA